MPKFTPTLQSLMDQADYCLTLNIRSPDEETLLFYSLLSKQNPDIPFPVMEYRYLTKKIIRLLDEATISVNSMDLLSSYLAMMIVQIERNSDHLEQYDLLLEWCEEIEYYPLFFPVCTQLLEQMLKNKRDPNDWRLKNLLRLTLFCFSGVLVRPDKSPQTTGECIFHFLCLIAKLDFDPSLKFYEDGFNWLLSKGLFKQAGSGVSAVYLSFFHSIIETRPKLHSLLDEPQNFFTTQRHGKTLRGYIQACIEDTLDKEMRRTDERINAPGVGRLLQLNQLQDSTLSVEIIRGYVFDLARIYANNPHLFLPWMIAPTLPSLNAHLNDLMLLDPLQLFSVLSSRSDFGDLAVLFFKTFTQEYIQLLSNLENLSHNKSEKIAAANRALERCLPIVHLLVSKGVSLDRLKDSFTLIYAHHPYAYFSKDEQLEEYDMTLIYNRVVVGLKLLEHYDFRPITATDIIQPSPSLLPDLMMTTGIRYVSIELPFIIRLAILKWSDEKQDKMVAAYLNFQAVCRTANQQVVHQEQQGRDFEPLLIDHQLSMGMLIQIMEEDVFAFLKKYVGTSLLQLERLFSCIEPLPQSTLIALKGLFEHHKDSILKGNMHADFAILLQQIRINIRLTHENTTITYPELLLFYKSVSENHENFSTVCTTIGRRLFDDYLHFLNIHTANKKQIEKTPLKLLTDLLHGRKAMGESPYKLVFDEMLKTDLTGSSFLSFIRSTTQASVIGKTLAQHNAQVHHVLKTGGIDLELALNFKQVKGFSCSGATDTSPINQTLSNIWSDLNALFLTCRSFPDKEKIQKTLWNIDNLQKKIVKGFSRDKSMPALNDLGKIRDNSNIISLKKICSALEQAIKDDPELLSLEKFKTQLVVHTKQLCKTLEDESNKTVKLVPTKNFTVKAWDKSDPATLSLGAHVGCCLAPTGSQFPAMVQRRMDDGMLMHVVVEDATGIPVALNWLFFGYDKQEPNKIYVVANFCEISATYGFNPSFRNPLVAHLLHFTNLYAEAVGAKGFLLNHLSYGLIPDFIEEKFLQKRVMMEKAGGFYQCPYQDRSGITQDTYYLASIGSHFFHCFSEKRLNNHTHNPQNLPIAPQAMQRNFVL